MCGEGYNTWLLPGNYKQCAKPLRIRWKSVMEHACELQIGLSQEENGLLLLGKPTASWLDCKCMGMTRKAM
eukprot:7467103-Pyramimonas_sp.AAC.1